MNAKSHILAMTQGMKLVCVSTHTHQIKSALTQETDLLLVQQENDFASVHEYNNESYIAPKIIYNKISTKAYDKITFGNKVREIREVAELPNFKAMDMRRTATTEMVDAGVPLPQIMSVTGHANAQSLTPYLKNTLTSATEALSKRNLGG